MALARNSAALFRVLLLSESEALLANERGEGGEEQAADNSLTILSEYVDMKWACTALLWHPVCHHLCCPVVVVIATVFTESAAQV